LGEVDEAAWSALAGRFQSLAGDGGATVAVARLAETVSRSSNQLIEAQTHSWRALERTAATNLAKVLDEVSLGTGEDEEELSEREITDRAYWEGRGSPISMKLVDECLEIIKEINPELSFNYNKYYIGLAQKNRPNNFVIVRAKKKFLRVEIRMADLDALKEKFNNTEIEVLSVDKRWGRLRFTLNKGEVEQNRPFLKDLFAASYKESTE